MKGIFLELGLHGVVENDWIILQHRLVMQSGNYMMVASFMVT